MAHLVLILGPHGSGRSTALEALKALGFAVSDTTGIPSTALLGGQGPSPERLAVVLNLELASSIADLAARIQGARRTGHRVDVLWLDAEEETLLARARNTPALAEYGLETVALEEERARLQPLKTLSCLAVDTTDLSPQQLQSLVYQKMSEPHRTLG